MSQGDNVSWSNSLGASENVQKVNGSLIETNADVDMKEPGIPNLTFNISKKIDDSQDIVSTELPNGHSTSNSTESAPRDKEKESMDQSEELPDTVLINPEGEKDDSCSKSENPKTSVTDANDIDGSKEHKTSVGDVSPEKKSSDAEESQDIFESSIEKNKSPNKTEAEVDGKGYAKEEDADDSNTLKLEVTESQFIKEDSTPDSSKEDANGESDQHLNDENGEDQSKPASSPKPSNKAEETPTESPTEKEAPQSEITENPQPDRSSPNYDEPCTCDPSCHARMHSISERLSGACKELRDFIKLKRRTGNPDLANLLSILSSIESIAENKPQSMGLPISDQPFYVSSEGGSTRKKSVAQSRYGSTPLKDALEKKSRKVDTPKPPEKNVDFQTIKGLAVFAKWPNSGWYYPGVIEGLSPSDWKEATNVTVTFYDGLVREMKNINILPANLIPAGVVLCDLDDETEMQVISSNSIEDNKVEFKLEMKDAAKSTVDVGFHKLAIRAAHMKSIKQVLEPTVDVVPKKMHMVSLDNLVSGRRSRIRTSKEDGDEIIETPRKGTRKSVRKITEETPMDDEVGDDEDAATKATPRRKRPAPLDQTSATRRQTKRSKQ